MEQLQETYEAGGFVFRTKKEAELAQREIEGTKYLRQKLDICLLYTSPSPRD